MPSHNIYEDELEQAALEWFEELGYETAFAPDISPGGDILSVPIIQMLFWRSG